MQSARGLFSDIFCMAILKFNNIGTIRGWQTSLRTGDLPDKDALLQEQRLVFESVELQRSAWSLTFVLILPLR